MDSAAAATPTETAAAVYPAGWRLAAAVLFAVSRTSPPLLFAALLLGQPPLTEERVIAAFAVLVALPALAAFLIRRAFTLAVDVGEAGITLRRRDLRIEIAREAVAGAAAWSVPLPGPGLSVRLRQGPRYSLQADSPAPLLAAVGAGAPPSPVVVIYAEARSEAGVTRWYHLLGKYGLFPLPFAAILFRLHQFLVHGGLLGQYYLEGLVPYLSTLGQVWSIVVINFVLYASAWRGAAEALCLAAAWTAPARATSVRRWLERTVQVAYYAGLPLLLARRFLVLD